MMKKTKILRLVRTTAKNAKMNNIAINCITMTKAIPLFRSIKILRYQLNAHQIVKLAHHKIHNNACYVWMGITIIKKAFVSNVNRVVKLAIKTHLLVYPAMKISFFSKNNKFVYHVMKIA